MLKRATLTLCNGIFLAVAGPLQPTSIAANFVVDAVLVCRNRAVNDQDCQRVSYSNGIINKRQFKNGWVYFVADLRFFGGALDFAETRHFYTVTLTDTKEGVPGDDITTVGISQDNWDEDGDKYKSEFQNSSKVSFPFTTHFSLHLANTVTIQFNDIYENDIGYIGQNNDETFDFSH